MNYEKIYDSIISREKEKHNKKLLRTDSDFIYYETHHIIPKCVDGSDEENNLVIVLPEIHYILHLLLIKMNRYKTHKNYYKLIFAARMLTVSNNGDWNVTRNNKEYGWLKRQYSLTLSKKMTGVSAVERYGSEERAREIINKAAKKMRGQQRSEETKEKLRKPKTKVMCPHCGKTGNPGVMSRWHFNNCGKEHKGTHRTPWSAETRRTMEGASGLFKKGQIPWNKGIKQPKLPIKTCPYCHLSGRGANMTRYHFNNCKNKLNTDGDGKY